MERKICKHLMLLLALMFSSFFSNGANVTGAVKNTTMPNCNDGAIDLKVMGGLVPYMYTWTGPNNFAATTEDISGLAAGNYAVTVTDGMCGTAVCKYEVKSTSLSLFYIFSKKNISKCASNGSSKDGAITIEVPAGNFTFKWTGPNNFTASSQNIDNLDDLGQYSVEITNLSGCKVTLSDDVCCCSFDPGHPPIFKECDLPPQNQSLVLSGTPNSPSTASSNDGSILLTVLPAYTVKYYNWTGPNGFTSNEKNILNLPPGDYCVIVSDGCNESSKCFNLVDCSSSGLAILSNQGNTCVGYSTGFARISNAIGGIQPYKVKWSNGSTDFTNAGLSAGNYWVTLTAAAGCTLTRGFNITNGTLLRNGCTILCDGSVIDSKTPIKDVFHEDNCTLVDRYCSDGYYLSTEFVGLKDIDIDQNNCVLTAICFNGEVYDQSFGINCSDCIFEVFNGGVYCCNVAYCYFPDFDMSFVKRIKEHQSVTSTQFTDKDGNIICNYQVFDDCNEGVELESGVVDCDEIPYFDGNCNEGFQEGDLLNGSFPNCFGLLTSAKKTMIDSNILAYFAKQEIKSTKIDWPKLNSFSNLGTINNQTIFFDCKNGSTYDLEFNSTFEGLVQILFQQDNLKKSIKLDFYAQNGLNKLHFDSNVLSNIDLTNFNIEINTKDYDFDLIRAKFSKSNFTFQNKLTESNSFTLFPNPVSNELSVIGNLKNLVSPNFKIFNIFGQAFLAKNVIDSKNENSFQIDLTEIPNGIYFLEITTTEQTPTIHKFIIQK